MNIDLVNTWLSESTTPMQNSISQNNVTSLEPIRYSCIIIL